MKNNLLLIALIGLISLNSCKKEEAVELKDIDYYKIHLVKDANFLGMVNALQTETDFLISGKSNSIFTAASLRISIKDQFSKEKIEKRVTLAGEFYKFFKKENPEFFMLKSEQQVQLFRNAIEGVRIENKSFNPIKIMSDPGWACMNGFNSMANFCASARIEGAIFAALTLNFADWYMDTIKNESSYTDCLNGAADAMDVCVNSLKTKN